MPARLKEPKIKRQMHPAQIVPVISGQTFDRQPDFTDKDAIFELIDYRAHFFNHFYHLWLVSSVQRDQTLMWWLALLITGINRIVTKLMVFNHAPDNVDAKSVYSTLKPKSHY